MRRASSSPQFALALCLLVSPALGAPTAVPAEAGPRAVSPGAPHGFTAIGSRCPTFSWGAVPDAGGYELAVYSLAGSLALPHLDSEALLGEPDLLQPIDAAATSWTPDLGRCFQAGRFAWTVRALSSAGSATGWSDPLLFEIRNRDSSATPGERLAALVDARLGADPEAWERLLVKLEAEAGLAAAPPAAAPIDPPRAAFLPADSLVIGGEYAYDPARTTLLFVTPNEFIPVSNGGAAEYNRQGNLLTWTAGAALSGIFVAPIHLVSGATVDSVRCNYFDNASGGDLSLSFALETRGIAGFTPSVLSQGSASSSGASIMRQIVFGDSAALPFELGGTRALWIRLTYTQEIVSASLLFLGCDVSFHVEHLVP